MVASTTQHEVDLAETAHSLGHLWSNNRNQDGGHEQPAHYVDFEHQ